MKGQPLGVMANDYRYASYSNQDDITYKSQQPLDIIGSYTFNLFGSDGKPQTGSASVLLLLEFTEAGSRLDSRVLSWIFMNFVDEKIGNVKYQLDGGWNYIWQNYVFYNRKFK